MRLLRIVSVTTPFVNSTELNKPKLLLYIPDSTNQYLSSCTALKRPKYANPLTEPGNQFSKETKAGTYPLTSFKHEPIASAPMPECIDLIRTLPQTPYAHGRTATQKISPTQYTTDSCNVPNDFHSLKTSPQTSPTELQQAATTLGLQHLLPTYPD